jgi:tRNA-dihydrouridine synthase B
MAIYGRVRDAVRCPVVMKLRTGFDDSSQSRAWLWEICERAVSGGIDALIVHGRTVEQRYRGTADWDVLGEVRRRFGEVTLVGSGDLFDAETAVRRLRSGMVDGVSIARGAVGNPWIYREIRSLLDDGEACAGPTLAEQREVILRHFDMILAAYPKRKGVNYFRKFTSQYARRHPRRKEVHLALMGAGDRDELVSALDAWYGE